MGSPQSSAQTPAFSVVVSEKGGAERREAFDQAEINIGRVQGNELMLPKGNVSKRHARLLFRDSRFIVTDLNSTNGTYVNRRRISQATIVREGDRIYIGDFVLRIEMPERRSAGDSAGSSGPVERSSSSQASSPSSQSDQSAVTHAPSEDHPEGSYPKVPGPPRVPSARGSGQHPLEPSRPGPRGTEQLREVSVAERSVTGMVDAPPDPQAQAHRAAMAAVADRVIEQLDLRAIERGEAPDSELGTKISQAVDEACTALTGDGTVPNSVDKGKLANHVRTELVELGPLTDPMSDDKVTEIAVPHFSSVLAYRNSQRVPIEPPFSSEAALRRAIARLCRDAGEPLGGNESIVNRVLRDGSRLSAVAGGAALSGAMLSISKAEEVRSSLDDLVRTGVVSRAIARFLQQCVAARANILVVGPRDTSTTVVLSALVASGDGPVVVFESGHDVVGDRPGATRFDLAKAESDAERLLRAATEMPGARIVIDGFANKMAGVTLDAIGEGADGVIAAARVPSLRRGLGRIVADIASAGDGSNLPAARESLVSSFDIAIEVARLRDGRYRVMRVAELIGGDRKADAQDVFTFNVERTAAGGSIEGTFNPSGTVPRIVDEMSARGISVESSMFSRPPSR